MLAQVKNPSGTYEVVIDYAVDQTYGDFLSHWRLADLDVGVHFYWVDESDPDTKHYEKEEPGDTARYIKANHKDSEKGTVVDSGGDVGVILFSAEYRPSFLPDSALVDAVLLAAIPAAAALGYLLGRRSMRGAPPAGSARGPSPIG